MTEKDKLTAQISVQHYWTWRVCQKAIFIPTKSYCEIIRDQNGNGVFRVRYTNGKCENVYWKNLELVSEDEYSAATIIEG